MASGYAEQLRTLLLQRKGPFCDAVRAAFPDRADKLLDEVDRWCRDFGPNYEDCVLCGRCFGDGSVFVWRDGTKIRSRAARHREKHASPPVCVSCVVVAGDQVNGSGVATEMLLAELTRAAEAAPLSAETAVEIGRILERRPRKGKNVLCVLCRESRDPCASARGKGSLCVPCIDAANEARTKRPCTCATLAKPADEPELQLTDSRSRDSRGPERAEDVEELWRCAACGQRWHCTAQEDIEGRRWDDCLTRLPPDHADRWPKEYRGTF